MAFGAALTGAHQFASVVTEEADLEAVQFAVEDYIRLLNLQLLLIAVLPPPPPHKVCELLKLSLNNSKTPRAKLHQLSSVLGVILLDNYRKCSGSFGTLLTL